jgi:hypothetical protein
MLQMSHVIVLLGVAVSFFGGLVYMRDTLSGTTKPNRVTFLIWAIAPLTAAAASFSSGVTWAVLPVFISGFIPLLILIASFTNKHAYWKLGFFDYVCGIFALLALLLWAITKDPDIAIVFAILSDAFAVLPTLRKAWKYPETETAIAYIAGLFTALTSFSEISTYSFAAVAFPAYLSFAGICLVFALYRKQIFKRV